MKKAPVKEFTFNKWIWQPKNYIIKNVENSAYNKYEIIKHVEYKNNTNYFGWRWVNFFKRTWVYFSNSFFLFGLVIPFASPFSYRALFSYSPFYPEKTVNQTDGTLITDKNTKVLTYCSRLRSIWSNVRESRRKFELIPDKGLIGKSVSRFFNVIWNYGFKGALGSAGLTLIYPVLCLLISTGSLILGLLTPVWYPILSVFHHLAFLFIYDWDHCGRFNLFKIFPFFTVLLIRLALLGTIQPISALATATIVCPCLSLLVALCIILIFFKSIIL